MTKSWQSARNMMEAVKSAVIAEQHSEEKTGAHGLHIELPSWSYGRPGDEYKELAFSRDTLWDEALSRLSDQGDPPG